MHHPRIYQEQRVSQGPRRPPRHPHLDLPPQATPRLRYTRRMPPARSTQYSIRQHTSAYVSIRVRSIPAVCLLRAPSSPYKRHTHTQQESRNRARVVCVCVCVCVERERRTPDPLPLASLAALPAACSTVLWHRTRRIPLDASAYVSIRQHTSAYVSIRQHTSAVVSRAYSDLMHLHTSAYVSIRQHTSAYVSIRQYAAPIPPYVALMQLLSPPVVKSQQKRRPYATTAYDLTLLMHGASH